MHLPLYTLWCIVHCININRMSHHKLRLVSRKRVSMIESCWHVFYNRNRHCRFFNRHPIYLCEKYLNPKIEGAAVNIGLYTGK